MPGTKKGPGRWIETRAQRILSSSSDQGPEAERRAFAIATLQAHKLGKAPKRGAGPSGQFGTRAARELAQEKFRLPASEYRKTAAQANLSGRDNRSPFVGRTQFPTEGSKQPALQKLREAKTVGSVATPRPAPVASFHIRSVVPRLTPSAALSKLSSMSPLMSFLRSTEAGQRSLEKLSEALDDNESFAPGVVASPRKRDVEVGQFSDAVSANRTEQRQLLRTLFANHKAARAYAKD